MFRWQLCDDATPISEARGGAMSPFGPSAKSEDALSRSGGPNVPHDRACSSLSLQATPMQADDQHANDAVGDRLALPSHLLQPLPQHGIDFGLPVAVRHAPPGREFDHARDQGAALVGDFNFRHRSRVDVVADGPQGRAFA